MLPFLGTQLLNHAAWVKSKVYVKPTKTGLLLHYQSHVNNCYKQSLWTMRLDHTHRLSSSWTYFSDECDCLKKFFSRLKYPKCLINSTINNFVHSRVADQHSSQVLKEQRAIVPVFIPIKDQESANYVKKQLKDLSLQVQTTVQPVFVSCKINRRLKVEEKKPQIVDQQCVVYHFQCDLCDAGYVGYMHVHLHVHVVGHKQWSSSLYKQYQDKHGMVSEDLLRHFYVLKKCKNIFDCLVHEMLFIRELEATLNVQLDSIHVKVFLLLNLAFFIM